MRHLIDITTNKSKSVKAFTVLSLVSESLNVLRFAFPSMWGLYSALKAIVDMPKEYLRISFYC